MRKNLAAIAFTLTIICIVAAVVPIDIAGGPTVSKALAALGFNPATTPEPTPRPTPQPALPPQPPIMVARSPEQGEEGGLEKTVIITFDQPMDWDSVKKAFRIEPEAPGELSWEDTHLIFTPTEPFKRGESYRVTVDESAKSVKGLALREPISFSFSTVGYLEVADVQPAPGVEDVDMDARVIVMFNRPVVPLTSISQQAGLPQPLTLMPPVEGEGEWLNTSIYTFRPTEGFSPATKYKARVAAGLEDTTGGLLEEDYTWTFTTKLPAVVSTVPQDNAIYVGPTEVITVTFNQPMARESAQDHFSLMIQETGKTVQGDFRWEDDENMIFIPTRSLKLDTLYMAQVKAGAKAAVGKEGTREDYIWSFTTISLPRIVSTSPADGDEAVDPYGGMDVTFSSPIDRDSLFPNLTILPEPTYVYSYWSNYDTELWLSFDLKPSSPYTVTFGADLRGRYGHTLDQDYTVAFTTRELDPMVYLVSTGNIGTYNAYTETIAYVNYRNVSRLNIRLYHLDRRDLIRFYEDYWWESWEKFKPDPANYIRSWSKKVEAPLNVSRITDIKLAGKRGGALEPGLYYLEVTGPGVSQASRQVLAVSRLNLTLKQGEKEALLWATDLANGQVVPDLKAVFYDAGGEVVAKGETDEDGVCLVEFEELDPWEPFFVFVKERDRGPDSYFALATNRWSDGIDPWSFNIDSEFGSPDYSGYFYTDRPIYRPGQKVYFKGIIRTDDYARYGLPEDTEEVQVTVKNSQDEQIYSEKLPLSDMGTLHGELTLDEEAPLGYYSISATYKDQVFWASFQVAEYRKPEFEVLVETDRDEYVQGDEIAVKVQANYYFGGPVANAQVRWALLTRDYFFRWEGKGWYDFTDYDWTRAERYYGEYGELVGEGKGQTDEEGRFTFKVPADIADKIASQVFTIEATVTDVNDQEVSSRTEAIVHKGLFYIGLGPQAYVGVVQQEQKVNVITVDWESQPVPGVEVEVVFYEHKWYSVQEKAEDGRFYWTSKYVDTAVFTQTVTTNRKGKAVAAFTPKKGGVYKIVGKGFDEEENEIWSSTYMWVSGYEFINWRQENTDRIDLVTDKKSYEPGETAQVLIPSPYQGVVKALLTIERGHIIHHELLTLETNSQLIEIPIESEYAPNVYVSVVIVKGTDETSPVPSFKVGYATLAVSTVEKELQVTITPDKGKGEHYQPRETVTYDIEARDHEGKGVEAEFSLTLVDRSVLALAEAGGPSLLDHFWRERGVGIRTATTLVLSIDRVNLEVAAEAKGGGGAEIAGAGIVRRRFPDTAYWNPAVRTDENGKAQVSVELPDTLTTWRLGAKAITADTEVGETTVDIVSTKDLLVRPVAPRFFVVGDEAQLSAVVHNNTDEPIETEISLSAKGLMVEDEAQKKVEVPAHGRGKVTWQTTVSDEKEAVLLYLAKGGQLSDAIEITLPIHRYSTPEVVATAGQLEAEGSRVEVVRLPERFDPSQGELTVEIDPSLAAGMRDGLQYLETFPYYCIEQIVSRFLPNVMTYRALKKLDIENPELEAKLPQYVGIGLQRLYALQHYDGGWGWWLLDDSDPYLTAYVLLGLNEARRADFAVEEKVMEDAAHFLRESLGRPADVRQPHKANTQAFILYVLAEYGEGNLGRTVALYQRRETLGNYGKAYLAMALNILAPEERKRVDALVSDLVSSAILSATGAHWEEKTIDYWTMNTNTRSTAIVLDALTRLSPDQGIIPNVVRWLMVARKEGHWETTQETAWSVIALTDYMVSTGELLADYSYQVRLNGEDWGEGTANAENLDEPQKLQVAVADLLRDVSNQIRIDRFKEADQTGEGRLYYAMYLHYFLPVEDIRALNRGLIVARQYSLVDEPDQWIDEAQVGDVIKVKLTIIAPSDLHYLVVEDPLPAGCEALDQSLKTTSVVGQRPELERVDEWDPWGWGWWWFSHTEVRDEKVVLFATYLPRGTYEYTYLMRASVPGEFRVIPSLAYQFYFPETFGRSDGAKFTVRPAEE